MIQTAGGAGELSPYPDANDRTASEHILSTLNHSKRRQQRRPTPEGLPYNPLADHRLCSSCGRRDGWRRIPAIGGGWACCWAGDLEVPRDDLRHLCRPLCSLGGAA